MIILLCINYQIFITFAVQIELFLPELMNYKKINSITGWVVCVLASAVYLLTIEPTASFWDCGEFISTAYKLEVGHPPGAPLFMLVGRIFTLFAGSNVEFVPKMVNIFSALCSGFTIMLLFWTITHLGRKITDVAMENFTPVQTISIIGSGVVGAFAYTFSDTFWFSAVEGEVYACSSLFTALVFWAVLRWEDEADQRYANRWLILIAYLMGLSIGVHLLNLLAIPAIGLVVYHRKFQNKITTKGTVYALLISSAVLLAVLYGIVPGVIQIAVWFELFFVKNMSLPMHTGLYLYAILLVGGIVYGFWYSIRQKKQMLNTVLLVVTVIIIGYSSYAALIIRSAAEPPMDQNNPQNLFNLQYYLNREQYGDRPLFFGPYYNSQPTDYKEGKTLYAVKDGKYVDIGNKTDYTYKDGHITIFPRMWSRESLHISGYKQWANIPERQVQDKLPTFGQNLRFFFSYQLNFMYMRYFMWNFAGRQNDIQGHGNPIHGNWISGITAWDEARLGPQDLPDSMKNKGRNVYYCLPLLLGLIGIFFQWQRNHPDFWVVMALFFMTGIAIVIYLNQKPYEPRERDYSYAGSFYAYAVWIGLGVMAIIEAIPEKWRNKYLAIAVSLALLLLVPGIMGKENWDDHDRSGRYTARDFAYNYLVSCEPDAIIFTNGDNDTFPLWYAQEVEGIATDVRVCNLSYLAADWYIEQMSRAAYESKPLPFSFEHNQYMSGTRDVLHVQDQFNREYIELKEVMDFVRSDNPRSKLVWNPELGYQYLGSRTNSDLWSGRLNNELRSSQYIDDRLSDFIPAKNLKITVDKEKVLSTGTVALKDSALIVPEIRWTLKGEGRGQNESIYKNSMMVLDILAHNNWERPVYFAITVSPENFLNLTDYFQMDGMAYRFVPVKSSNADRDYGRIDTDILYDKMINQFRWGNISDPKVYLCETNTRLISRFRMNFGRLAGALNAENKKDSAVMALDRAFEVIPTYQLPLSYADLMLLEQYYRAGAMEKGNAMAEEFYRITSEELDYFQSFPKSFTNSIRYEMQNRRYVLVFVCGLARQYDRNLFETFKNRWEAQFPQEPLELLIQQLFDDDDDDDEII